MSDPCYTLNIPLMNSAMSGMNSSVHQLHVPFHVHGFSRIQDIQNEIITNKKLIPSFAKSFITANKTFSEQETNWKELAIKNPLKPGKGIPKHFQNF